MLYLFLLCTMSCFPREPLQTLNEENSNRERLSVMTLNLAHGRLNGPHQVLLPSNRFSKNVQMIADFIVTERPDIVALQEADGPSSWSGQFDHVRFLAENTALPYSFRGSHNRNRRLDYGTALLSTQKLLSPKDYRFPRYAPLPPKGFVQAQIQTTKGKRVQLVSIHLDPLRDSVRQKQLEALVQNIAEEKDALVIMGDFNMEWSTTLSELCKQLKIKAYQPASKEAWLQTFPKAQRRLDWILVSEHLEFLDYTVHHDPLSDHYAVSATILFSETE